MPRLITYQTNFASGEIDPTLLGQTSLRAYQDGVKKARNVQRRATGGYERRWGTYDLNGLPSRSNAIPFEFSDTQRYVFCFYNGGVKIFDLNGTLLTTLSGPWTEQQAFELGTTQRGDTMIVCHSAFWPKVIQRTGPSSFTIADFTFDTSLDGNRLWQPYYKFAPAAVTLSPSAATGSITLTASAPWFDASFVGQRIKIYDAEVLITAYTDSTHVTGSVQGTLKGSLDLDPFKTTKGSVTVEVLHLYHGLSTGASITLSGGNTTGDIPGSFFNGTFTVTVIDEIRYSITLSGVSFVIREDVSPLDGTPENNTYTAARFSEDGGGPNVKFTCAGTATRNWAEPAFSSRQGYPATCCFHEGRLWFGGTAGQPDGAFGSKALLFFNHDLGKGYDGEAVQVAAGTEDVSRIRHMLSNGELQVFTALRESIFITREGEAITPNNARVKNQSNAGCNMVQPVIFDGATLFVQDNGLSISEFVYSNQDGGYIPTPISTLASHLIRTPQSLASSPGTTSRSEEQAFIVNGDGTVAVFHSMRKENIAGFGLWEFPAALVHSACCTGNYIFFTVYAHGAYRLYRYAEAGLACLDGQVAHSNATPKTGWTVDARVRNRICSIVSELGYHGDIYIPADGSLTLSVPVKNVIVGDAFYLTIELLPPVVALPTGEQTGLIKRIVRSIINFSNALGITVNGAPLLTRNAGTDLSLAPTPKTGPVEFHHLGFARDGNVVISQNEPLPAMILSVSQEVKV